MGESPVRPLTYAPHDEAMAGLLRLKIWTWSGRDVVSLSDIELVAAVASRKELHALTTRLRLPKAANDAIYQVKPASREGQLALDHPGRLVWRDITDHDAPDGGWRNEEDLDDLRASSSSLRVDPRGRPSTPLHRP